MLMKQMPGVRPISAEAIILTGDRGVNISGFGGDIRGTDLPNLHQQCCHIIIEWREGLTEGHQAGQDGHEERVALGTGQH